ncbi:hypothetical protein R6Q59_010087 [Mikania micrantha]
MPLLNQVEVTLQINGIDLPEYEDADLDADSAAESVPTVARYVQSSAGQQFAVRLRFDKDFKPKKGNTVMIELDFDGQQVARRSRRHTARRNTRVLAHRTSGRGQLQGDFSGLKEKYRLGETTEVRLWDYMIKGRISESSKPAANMIFETELPKKAIKGRAVTMGIKYIGSKPFARFVFHYRSKSMYESGHMLQAHRRRMQESLQDLLILPREAMESEVVDNGVGGLTIEELRALIRSERVSSLC